MSQQRPQRRNYLPQKGAQSRFVVTLLLIIFLVSVITFCNLWVIGNWVVAAADLGTQIQFSDVFEKIRDLVWWRVGLIILVNLIIVGIIGIFYSHQFAGPSYKLEKCVREIAQGDLSFKIFLRTNDAMHNVADRLHADGLFLLGFPLHPQDKPEKPDPEVLYRATSPTLFIQGTRDRRCDHDALRRALRRVGAPIELYDVAEADSNFHVPKKSGRTDEQVQAEVLGVLSKWIGKRLE